jgi:hydrogenase/urease accessory protein HupE
MNRANPTPRSALKSRRSPARLARLAAWNGLFLSLLLAATAAQAHPLAPALLQLEEKPGGVVDVLWKRSALSVPGSSVEPVLPPACPATSPAAIEQEGVAVFVRWTIDCGAAGLIGQPVRVEGLGPAKIDTLVRIALSDGRSVQRVLRRSEPEMIVPAKASRLQVFVDYLSIGFDHILGGTDHLLFVFGLFLLCAGLRPLVKTITSFTVGHSITLSLAALGYTQLPSGPIEVLIAASVLALAVELARDGARAEARETLMRRYPWPMALLFGLLHGMGFAGALREVGLPQGEIPMALFSFNVGIELGQLAFVTALVVAAAMVRRVTLPIPLPQRAAVYAMGSLAAFWTIERAFAVF